MPEPREHRGQEHLPARREPMSRELVTVRARADVFRHRLDESRERFRLALEQFSASTAELSPAARMRAHPWRWVLGGFALGVIIGLVTTRESGADAPPTRSTRWLRGT